MKVTFVALGQEQLAISLLSAVLQREGHTTSLAFNPALFDDRYFLDIPFLANIFDRSDDVVDQIVAAEPDLVAFSVLTPMYQWALAISRAVKERIDVPVILGGVHPSAVPEVCLDNDCVDYVCVGEGEHALVELCEILPLTDSRSRPRDPIANLSWMHDGQMVVGPPSKFNQDLDELPYWDKEIWSPHVRVADNWLTMTSRGCPYRCTFCFNNFFAKLPGKGGGKYLRQRSVDNVIGELVQAKERWNIKRVDFEDDIFTTNKTWIRAFLTEYKREIDLPFQCLVHPRYIDDDMARWLKDAGCQHVQMGVQSADEEYKRYQLLRMEKEAHMSASLHALRQAGLDTKLDHMLGLPGEPLSAQELARELYAEYPPRRIQTFWLTHLPGIELTKSALASGDINQEDYDRVNRGESGRFHTRSSADAADATAYRRYEMLFRLLPLLPLRAQRRLRVRHIPEMSATTATLLGTALEVANSVRYRDAESFNYVKHYARQIRILTPQVIRESMRRRNRSNSVRPDRGGMSLGGFGSPRIPLVDDVSGASPPTDESPRNDPSATAVPVVLTGRPSVGE